MNARELDEQLREAQALCLVKGYTKAAKAVEQSRAQAEQLEAKERECEGLRAEVERLTAERDAANVAAQFLQGQALKEGARAEKAEAERDETAKDRDRLGQLLNVTLDERDEARRRVAAGELLVSQWESRVDTIDGMFQERGDAPWPAPEYIKSDDRIALTTEMRVLNQCSSRMLAAIRGPSSQLKPQRIARSTFTTSSAISGIRSKA
jgi:chromosome segregation ATPase